jgi:hypothetical protein
MTVAEVIRPQTHEIRAHLIFAERGLDPYYWLDSVRKNYDGWQTEGKPTATMMHRGHEYALAYDYDGSGLDPWNHEDYHLETAPEFKIYFARKDALYNGERADRKDARAGAAGTITFRPRWPDLTSDGKKVSVPDLGGPYVDAEIQASNHHPSEYPELLRGATTAFGGNPSYFRDIHEASNVIDLAVYVRLLRSDSGPVHAADGPIARMHSLLEGDRSGYRKHVEDHTKIPGYYVTTTLTPDRMAELIRGHTLPVEIKHYYPENPSHFDPDDALYHPKVEVAYQTSQTDEALYWSDVMDAHRELTETLANTLDWAGISLRAGEPYRSDQYFDAGDEKRMSLKLVNDPTPEIESQQENRIMKLWGDMMESDREVVEHLLSDGGSVSPQEAADATGNSYRTIRRVIDRLEGVIQHSYGDIQIASKRHQQELLERVRAAAGNFKSGVEAAVVEAADAGADTARSAWKQAKHNYDVTVKEGRNCRKVVKIGYRPESKQEAVNVARRLKLAFWETFGRDARIDGIHAKVRFADGTRRRYQLTDLPTYFAKSDRRGDRADDVSTNLT